MTSSRSQTLLLLGGRGAAPPDGAAASPCSSRLRKGTPNLSVAAVFDTVPWPTRRDGERETEKQRRSAENGEAAKTAKRKAAETDGRAMLISLLILLGVLLLLVNIILSPELLEGRGQPRAEVRPLHEDDDARRGVGPH